jgi:penicillin amidase
MALRLFRWLVQLASALILFGVAVFQAYYFCTVSLTEYEGTL